MTLQVASPRYGYVMVGQRKFLAVFDGEDKLYFDRTGAGGRTAVPVDWAVRTFARAGAQSVSYRQGNVTVDIAFAGTTFPGTISIWQAKDNSYGYNMDFGLTGTATLAGKSYKALYLDDSAAFDGRNGLLIIDEKGDGNIGPAYFHPVGMPFLLDGKEYEFGRANGTYALMPSTKKFEPYTERDPNEANGLKVGSPARSFRATTMDGNKLSFPGSFKGKVVMLDFWATWCGPCMAEAPNVVKAYKAWHDKGFEILGVSLDEKGDAARVKSVTAEKGMTWEQVYDGRAWKGAVPGAFGIRAIPEAYLVDGDTGKILAFGDGIRGDKLSKAIEKALAAKQRAGKK
jgi:thiol-disulfide isomerase/thioredoxin